ncbi:hypothetical protein HDU67_001635, partial [Dinochytrium kinnereticum]
LSQTSSSPHTPGSGLVIVSKRNREMKTFYHEVCNICPNLLSNHPYFPTWSFFDGFITPGAYASRLEFFNSFLNAVAREESLAVLAALRG